MDNPEIYNTPSKSIYYMAVGSAANLFDKKILKLKPEDNHQFPPFLKKINNQYPNKTINIILIDPNLSTPPYIVKSDWVNHKLYYQKKNIKVFAFWENVSYFDFKYNIRIINFLIEFVEFIKKNKHFLFYHDFTGRDINFLNQKFNDDRILFDITRGDNQGCYCDLSLLKYQPIIIKNKIFKPELMNKEQLIKYYSLGDIYKKQICHCLKTKLNEFKNIINIYRKLKLDKKNLLVGIKPNYNFLKLDFFQKISFIYEIPIENKFIEMLKTLKYEKYLKKICKMMHKVVIQQLLFLFNADETFSLKFRNLETLEKLVLDKYKFDFGYLLEDF